MDFLNSALTPNGKTEKTARLVTLLGPGGAGKTRLALEAARRLQPEYGGAVRFIPLSTLKSEFQLIAALSQALSPHDPSIADSLEHLADSLGISPLLLVLDNFEQMDEDSAVSVRSLLGRAPGLRVLVTSRRPLNVEGERQFNLPPLPVPASEEAAEALLENPSVQLFLDRAGRVKSDFDLTQLNAADIAALCRQLEGMPLALELAAGWASSLSPSQTRERLSRRFDLLVSRRKDIDERHRSLLSAITWSYEQLPIELQRLFARLSVFRGSWTLEAADSICADSAITADEGSKPFSWSLNGMEQLRERSLIIADQAGDCARFRMLESLREYAELQVPPDERGDLRRNHAYYFLALAEQSASHLFGPEQAEWLHRLEADHGNLCAAVEWAAGDDGVVDVGLRIVAAVARFWDTRYHRADAERLWDILSVKVDSASPSAHAAGIEAMAGLAINQDDHSIGQERLNEAFVIYGDLSDEAGIARIRCWLGASYRDEGRFAEARQLMEASLAFFERHTDLLWKSNALAGLADCALNEGEYQTARSLMEQCAALRRIAGNHRGFAWCKLNEGRTAIIQGELQTAAAFLEESVRLFRMVADPVYLIQALAYLAYVEKHIGDQDRAEGIAGEALTFARRTRLPRWEAPILLLLGDIARDCERPDDARTRYLEATRLCYERELAFGLKCALAGLGKLEDQNGLIERAVCICAAGMKIDSTPDHDPIYSNAINLSVQLEDLERKADHVVFKSAWQRGSTMTPSQVIAYASSEVAQA